MVETRSQRQRAQRGAARALPGPGRGRGRGAPPPPPAAPPIQGQSSTLYDVQHLSPNSSARMAQGIATDFWVDELRSHPVGHPTYFAFQLKKPVSVRIHDPERGPNRVECSCGDDSTCCVHIYVSITNTSAKSIMLIRLVAFRCSQSSVDKPVIPKRSCCIPRGHRHRDMQPLRLHRRPHERIAGQNKRASRFRVR